MNVALEGRYNFGAGFPKVLMCGCFISELVMSISAPVTLPWNLPEE